MNYLTCKQIAETWGLTPRRVQDLCKAGVIRGAMRHGREWLIPADVPKPADRRKGDTVSSIREGEHTQSFFFSFRPGELDDRLSDLAPNRILNDLFRAQIHTYRGEIEQAKAILFSHKADRVTPSARGLLSTILSLCATATGDLQLWQEAAKYIEDTPCHSAKDRLLIDFWRAANASIISDISHFPPHFRRGDFSELPPELHVLARQYYARYLYLSAHETPVENISGRVVMLFMHLLPLTVEPLISQTRLENAPITELILRLQCAAAYHASGQDLLAREHIRAALDLTLPDRLYLPLAEFRNMLGSLLDEELSERDVAAFAEVKRLYKTFHRGWIAIHNHTLNRTVSENLSKRERQIASLAVYGLSNKEIADRLGITVAAVKQTLRSVMDKTNARNRKELYLYV